MDRQTFLKSAAAAAAGLYFAPLHGAAPQWKPGLQLYTLRDTLPKNPKGVVKSVADMGYKCFEVYDYDDGMVYGLPYKEFADYVKSVGCSISGGHYQIGADSTKKCTVLGNWQKAIDDAAMAGQNFMTVSSLAGSERKTLDDYRRYCQKMNEAGEKCRKAGIQMAYHNHAFEFDMLEGQVPYDLMLKELDPKVVSLELDIYWMVSAGRNPLDYFRQHPGRFHQWHVKDMSKADRTKNANVGTGSIDFKSIFDAAKQAGLRQYYIEQESYPVSPEESARESLLNLRKLLG